MNTSNNNNSIELSKEADGVNIGEWNLAPSETAANVVNPIRKIVDGMTISPNPEKELIKLTIGDPSVFGNLDPAEECINAVVKAAQSGKYNGYPSSIGHLEARQAVADYSTDMGAPARAKDVVLTSGCSQSLEIVITLLANRGQNILIPRPGFPLYKTLAHSIGVETKFYDLMPEENWAVDLESLRAAIDSKTAAVIVNSPSNPCGSVFTREHVQDIIDICDAYKVPIIADEVYENVTHSQMDHHPMAAVSQTVPVLTVSSLSKRFLVPGWRLGWVIVHDRSNAITGAMRDGLVALTQRTLSPCSLLQGALPDILRNTPDSHHSHTNTLMQENTELFYEAFSRMSGLSPIKSYGAMYMMVRVELDCFPDFDSDIPFTERLMSEESVFCLPASCFSYSGYFRIVLSIPQDKAIEACARISQFCDRHYLQKVAEPVVKTPEPADPLAAKRQTFQRISSNYYLLNNHKR